MIDTIIRNTKIYIQKHNKKNRKCKGQFFTPVSIAEFMALKAAYATQHLSILDPGAGNGLLTASIVKYCIENELCNSFDVNFVENDTDVIELLKSTIITITNYVTANNGNINISLSTENYITGSVDEKYDIVICNPPYKKIRKDSEESQSMENYVHGQPNLYGLFMCQAIKHLKDNGRFVFITPRSWTSGYYYKLVRKYIFEKLNITDLLLFENRNNVFNGEDVLQETLITVGIKGNSQSQFIYLYNVDSSSQLIPMQMEVPAQLIKNIGPDSYLLLPKNENDLQVISRMANIPDTFESLGYRFKTGPVVEFRNRDAISAVAQDGYIPMYRSTSIVNGQCVFPADTGKAQYLNSSKKQLLIANGNTVFLKRLSAKEENRRLQSCVYYQTGNHEYISVENHVNYLVRSDRSALTEDEVEWINELLMSEDYDVYYRIINGSTQVNARELNRLPLQRR